MHAVIMKKSQQRDTVYRSVSRNEARLVGAISESDLAVFGIEEIASLTRWERARIHNTLRALESKGTVVRIKRNAYALEDVVAERSFEVATEVVKPSYISFWTALSYYGFTEQQVRTIQLVSTKQNEALRAGPHTIEATKFKSGSFYGYGRVEGFVIADKEKALVDSLYIPEKCGGLDEFAKCLKNSWPEIDGKRLAEYTIRFGNASLISRMGHLLEALGLGDARTTEKLLRHRSESYVRLSPGDGRTVGHDGRWRIIVNHEIMTEGMA
jgi:predicted transcriptional regulator of viral defense system